VNESQTPPVLTDLTEFEQQVVDAARLGEVVKPTATATVEDLADTADPALRIRAELLRDLLRGLHGDLDPRGIQVIGVRVVGQLDLDHVTGIIFSSLLNWAFDQGFCVRDMSLTVKQGRHRPDSRSPINPYSAPRHHQVRSQESSSTSVPIVPAVGPAGWV
jgi:hypothetical protein